MIYSHYAPTFTFAIQRYPVSTPLLRPILEPALRLFLYAVGFPRLSKIPLDLKNDCVKYLEKNESNTFSNCPCVFPPGLSTTTGFLV